MVEIMEREGEDKVNEYMLAIKNITKLEPNSVYMVDFNSNIISFETIRKYLKILNEQCKQYNITFILGKW